MVPFYQEVGASLFLCPSNLFCFPLGMTIIQLMDMNITTTSLVICLIIPFSQLLKYF
jgi:hypothetical protein